MKSVFNYIIAIVFLCACSMQGWAQSQDGNIKAAKATATSAIAQDPNKLPPDSLKWKKGGSASLNFSQTQFSNWSGGGENMLAFNSTLTLFANYKKNKFIWENNGFFAYGLMKKGGADATKNDDQLNVGSRVGYEMAKNWYYSLAFLGKSQFAPGYKYSADDTVRISDFLAPASLYLSLGLDYKPSSKFSMSLSPVMGKATVVRSHDPLVLATAGISKELIDKGKTSRYEFGGGIVFNLNGNFYSKRVTYITQLELFSNYLKDPQNVDVFWDFQFRIALTRFISAGVRLNMIYDDDQKTTKRVELPDGTAKDEPGGAKLQVKEFFEIGFFYGF